MGDITVVTTIASDMESSVGPSAVPVFIEDFESGGFSSPTGGSWSTAGATVVSTISHTGTYSARLTYKAYDDPGNGDKPGAWATMIAQLTSDIQGRSGLWSEHMVFFPNGDESPDVGPQVYHSKYGGATTDQWKLHRAYANPYVDGPTVGFDMDNALADGGSEVAPPYRDRNGTLMGASVLDDHFNFLPGIDDSPTGYCPRGEWVQLRFYYLQASERYSYDGVIKMWINGSLRWSKTDVDLTAEGGGEGKNYFDRTYFFNYKNGGFEVETYVYVDNVKIYDSDPGW